MKAQIPLSLAVFITAKILKGLSYAHNKKDKEGNKLNIIHRDVSPDNILVSWDGEVKIVKLDVDDHPNLAMHYQVMGVPTLMLFKSGQPVERVTGYQPKDRLSKQFSAHL